MLILNIIIGIIFGLISSSLLVSFLYYIIYVIPFIKKIGQDKLFCSKYYLYKYVIIGTIATFLVASIIFFLSYYLFDFKVFRWALIIIIWNFLIVFSEIFIFKDKIEQKIKTINNFKEVIQSKMINPEYFDVLLNKEILINK